MPNVKTSDLKPKTKSGKKSISGRPPSSKKRKLSKRTPKNASIKHKTTKHKPMKEAQQPIGDKMKNLFYDWVKKRTKPKNLINDMFAVRQLIGSGTFGRVYLAENVLTKTAVAVKLEYEDAYHPQLKYEKKLYDRLGNDIEGFIEIYYYGPYGLRFYALCMELLGPDLDDLFGKSFNGIYENYLYGKKHDLGILQEDNDLQTKEITIILNNIGRGTFGMVFLGENVQTHAAVAVKLEETNCAYPQLRNEMKIYETLGTAIEGFIEINYFGAYGTKYQALVMELLGPDLNDLFCACNRHFSLKTVLMIGIRVIKLIEHVHTKQIIYRDIKPENFCIGHHYNKKEKVIFIVDFGLSKLHEDPVKKNPEEIQYLIGTARYMSLNALRGGSQSQRDDLEAISYMLTYFLYGTLPWMGLSSKDEGNPFENILKIKENLTSDELCPDSFAITSVFEYARSLVYNKKPDYHYLIKLLEKEMKENKFVNDGIYDWTEIMGRNYLTEAINIDPDE